MIKVLFVCLGNICRSPMAEFILEDMVKKEGLENEFQIRSAATSSEETGNGVYPPAKAILAEHGISAVGKTAVQITKSDYDYYDYIIAMDNQNLRDIKRIVGNDDKNKLSLLMDYTSRPGNVADPWYTRDFTTAWNDIEEGCRGFLNACNH